MTCVSTVYKFTKQLLVFLPEPKVDLTFREFYLFFPSIFSLIRRVNDMLRDLSVIKGFTFIFNDMITAKCLWKYGIHIQDLSTSISSKNFIKIVNYYIVVLTTVSD